MSRQRCLDSFHPRVLIVKAVSPCVTHVVALHGSRRLKRVSASIAHKPYKQRSWCRPRGNWVSRSTQSLSPCRSRTSQVDGCLSRSLPVLQASTPEFHGYSSGQAKRAYKRSLRGYGDLSRMGMQWNNTRGLSVFLLERCYQKACPKGMRRWKRRAFCCMSCGVHIGGVASGVSSQQAAEVGVPFCQGTQCWVV